MPTGQGGPAGPSQMPMDQSQMQHGTMPMSGQAPGAPAQTMPMDHAKTGQMKMATGEHAGHAMAMTGNIALRTNLRPCGERHERRQR